jgi:UDP-N-acetylglucosamine acyltransferase
VSAATIHPTAVVAPGASLGAGVSIGAFSVIGPQVALGDGAVVGHHAVLEGRLDLGPRVHVGHGTVLGGLPQDLKFDPDTPSGVRIGADTVIREQVTIHRATKPGAWTEVGARCLLMAQTHIGHDCRVGDGVILTNFSALGGHCEIDDFVTISGYGGLPQFTRIGTFAFLGGYSKLEGDLPPYMLANGIPATVRGINNVGLRRAGMSPGDRRVIKEAYRILYRSGLAPGAALERLRREVPATAAIERLIAFVATATRRGICAPPRGWRDSAGAPAGDPEEQML